MAQPFVASMFECKAKMPREGAGTVSAVALQQSPDAVDRVKLPNMRHEPNGVVSAPIPRIGDQY